MSTITDRYGRQWTVAGNTYRTDGVEIVSPAEWTEDEALERFNAMQPEGWVEDQTHTGG